MGEFELIYKLLNTKFYGNPAIFEINDPKYAKYKPYKDYNGGTVYDLYDKAGLSAEDALNLAEEIRGDSDQYDYLVTNNRNLYPTIKKLNGGDEWQQRYTTEQEQKALADVKDKLNESLKTLATEYNDRITILNTNEDTLSNTQQYFAIKNAKLRNQLKQIYALEDNIRKKQKLTQINNDHYKRQIAVNSCLKMMLPVLLVISLLVGGYLWGRVSLGVMMGIVIVILALYGWYVWYKLNEINKPAWQRNSIEKDFAKIGQYIYDQGRELEKEFIDENCDCPSDQEGGRKDSKASQMGRGPGSTDPTNNGPPLLYNDGSSPTQVIYPEITSKEQSIDMNAGFDINASQRIKWEGKNCSYDNDCGKNGNPKCCLDNNINSPYQPTFTWTAGL